MHATRLLRGATVQLCPEIAFSSVSAATARIPRSFVSRQSSFSTSTSTVGAVLRDFSPHRCSNGIMQNSIHGNCSSISSIGSSIRLHLLQNNRLYTNSSRKNSNNNRNNNKSNKGGSPENIPDFQSLMRAFYKKAHPDIIRSYDAEKVRSFFLSILY